MGHLLDWAKVERWIICEILNYISMYNMRKYILISSFFVLKHIFDDFYDELLMTFTFFCTSSFDNWDFEWALKIHIFRNLWTIERACCSWRMVMPCKSQGQVQNNAKRGVTWQCFIKEHLKSISYGNYRLYVIIIKIEMFDIFYL